MERTAAGIYVFVLDDEKKLSDLFVFLLKNKGFENAIGFTDPHDAVAYMEEMRNQLRPDNHITSTDFDLENGFNGHDFTKLIRQKIDPIFPVIANSGRDPLWLESNYPGEFNAIIQKPGSMLTLVSKISEVMGLKV